jgi:hypothetical protein
MVIFNSYVKLPEGIYLSDKFVALLSFQTLDMYPEKAALIISQPKSVAGQVAPCSPVNHKGLSNKHLRHGF